MRGTTRVGIVFSSVMSYIGIAILSFQLWQSTGGLACDGGAGKCTEVAGVLWPILLPIWAGIHKPLLFWLSCVGVGGSLLSFHQIKTFFQRIKKKVVPPQASLDPIEIESVKEVNRLLED
jgi:hypothetical protein